MPDRSHGRAGSRWIAPRAFASRTSARPARAPPLVRPRCRQCRSSLQRVCEHIDQVQAALGRRILLENPATYLEFAGSTWSEGAFMTEVLRRTGCGLLLDVNNVYVSSTNHGRDPLRSLRELPWRETGEIHLAGFAEDEDGAGARLLIDNHGAPVAQAVWSLYDEALALTGPQPTLIERDNDVPAFEVLLREAKLAESHMEARREAVATS